MWGNVNFLTVFLNFLIFLVYLFNKEDLKIHLKHISNKYYLLRTCYLLATVCTQFLSKSYKNYY